MSVATETAILVDFFPSSHPPPLSLSHPPTPSLSAVSNHRISSISVKNAINDSLHAHDRTLLQVYVLTSRDLNVTLDLSRIIPDHDVIERFLVRGDARVASFYAAKQKLDDLEVQEMEVVCEVDWEPFWTQVCTLLLTPVHSWVVKTVGGSSSSSSPHHHHHHQDDPALLPSLVSSFPESKAQPGNSSRRKISERELVNATEMTHIACPVDVTVDHPPLAPSSDAATKALVQRHLRTLPSLLGPPEVDHPPAAPSSDAATKALVQRHLRSLPSLLGPPEVDRAAGLRALGAGLVHGFSTRRGGVSAAKTLCAMNLVYTDLKPDSQLVVEENRRRLATVGGFDHLNFHITKVEHGNKVWVVGGGGSSPDDEEGDPRPLKFDALVTARRDVTLAAAGADCILLLFADPVAMVIGAAHAGWKGSVERVGASVLTAMTERFGCRPEDVRVAMGPGVRPGCFVVPEEDEKLFRDIHPECVVGEVDIDLFNRQQGRGVGVTADCSASSLKLSSSLHKIDGGIFFKTCPGQGDRLPFQAGSEVGVEGQGEGDLQVDCAVEGQGEVQGQTRVEVKTAGKVLGQAGHPEEECVEVKDESADSVLRNPAPAPQEEETPLESGYTQNSEHLTLRQTSGPDLDLPAEKLKESGDPLTQNQHLTLTQTSLPNLDFDLTAGFMVQQVAAEQLRPKRPRSRKDPGRRWVHVDLQRTNYHVLLQAGVKAAHIDTTTSHCTACNPHLYFSYERDGFPFGNQIGFISMPSSPGQ